MSSSLRYGVVTAVLASLLVACADWSQLFEPEDPAETAIAGEEFAVGAPTGPDEILLAGEPVDPCFGIAARQVAEVLGAAVAATPHREFAGFFPAGVRDPEQAAPAVSCRWETDPALLGEVTIRTGMTDVDRVMARLSRRSEFREVDAGVQQSLWQGSATTLWARDGDVLVVVQVSGGTRPAARLDGARELVATVMGALRPVQG